MSAPIVDCHVHLYRSAAEGERGKVGYEIWEYGPFDGVRFSRASGDVESARAAIAAAGASWVVVANLHDVPRPGVPLADDLRAFNHWLCDLAARDPRFVPLIAVDPHTMSVEENARHLREMVVEYGARGIKLHPPLQHLDFADRRLWPLIQTCVELDVVVLSHSGPSRDGSGIGEPNAFRPLLDAYPDLRIVLAHMGGAAWRQLPGIARDYPSVMFDCCEIVHWLGAPKAPSVEAFVDLVRAVGVERVMMGSDFPWYDIDVTVEKIRGLPGLTDTERDAILGGNAVRFFRLGI
jgi:predicted TIM-barrel fold metal-dependent hydrolase